MSENTLRDAFVQCIENNEFQVPLSASRVKILMDKLNENFESMQTEEDCIKVCQSFYSRNVKVFRSYKNTLLKYIEYAISYGEMTEAQLNLLGTLKYEQVPVPEDTNEAYFTDFESLKAAVEETFLLARGVDRDVYLPSVVAIYLAWNGVTLEQMCNIKKSDVTFLSIIVDGKKIQLSRPVMNVIEAYVDSVGYGTAYAYKKSPSEYLFRTVKKAKLDTRNIKNAIVAFNALNQRKYGLSFKKVYMSGALRRAYEYEKQNGEIDILKEPTEHLIDIFGININGKIESRYMWRASFRAFKAQIEYVDIS